MKPQAQDISIRQAQALVDHWITTVGVRYFSPLTNMAILAEETGEVARVMARRFGDQSFKEGEADTLADELADVMWVVMAIANQSGIDLADAFVDDGILNLVLQNRSDTPATITLRGHDVTLPPWVLVTVPMA